MTDYIKREDATEVYSKLYWMHEGLLNFQEELGKVYDEILSIPSADAAPVRHGHWIKNDPHCDGLAFLWNCSECGGESDEGYRYCPACGAIMDKEVTTNGNSDQRDHQRDGHHRGDGHERGVYRRASEKSQVTA